MQTGFSNNCSIVTSLVIQFLLCGPTVVLPDIPITHLLLAHEPSLKFRDWKSVGKGSSFGIKEHHRCYAPKIERVFMYGFLAVVNESAWFYGEKDRRTSRSVMP